MRTLLPVAMAFLIGCGKKEDAPPLPSPLAWADGHYACDRLSSPAGAPVCTGEADLTVAAGVVKGMVRQSTNNRTGTIPEVIEISYEVSGPLTLRSDGSATFDISGRLPTPTPGPYHVSGEIRPKGMVGVKAQCTADMDVVEIEPINDKDARADAGKDRKIAPKKSAKKPFSMAGEGVGMKH